MIYIIVVIGIVALLIFILWIRKSSGNNYNHRSNVWQHHQDQNYIDDYVRKSKKTPPPPYNDEFWDPYD